MKKIISLFSVILSLVFVLTMFTACGEKTDINNSETQNEAVVQKGFTAEIENKRAVVKKDGEVFQVLDYPKSNTKFDKKYATKNNEFLDMNFDGNLDFYIAICSENDVISYYCWLYNATTNKFDYSVILSELKNISVDSENHRILSSIKVDDENHVLSYKWVDGQLVLDTDYSDKNGGIPEDVTQVVNDNVIGNGNSTNPTKPNKPTNPQKPVTTTSKNNPGSATTTKPSSKPNNTTTTIPGNSNGVVLETGSLNDGGWY